MSQIIGLHNDTTPWKPFYAEIGIEIDLNSEIENFEKKLLEDKLGNYKCGIIDLSQITTKQNLSQTLNLTSTIIDWFNLPLIILASKSHYFSKSIKTIEKNNQKGGIYLELPETNDNLKIYMNQVFSRLNLISKIGEPLINNSYLVNIINKFIPK